MKILNRYNILGSDVEIYVSEVFQELPSSDKTDVFQLMEPALLTICASALGAYRTYRRSSVVDGVEVAIYSRRVEGTVLVYCGTRNEIDLIQSHLEEEVHTI